MSAAHVGPTQTLVKTGYSQTKQKISVCSFRRWNHKVIYQVLSVSEREKRVKEDPQIT